MSGWDTTILVAGSSRRKDSDLSRGTEMTRLVAASLGRASAYAGLATAPALSSVRAAQSAAARLRGMVLDSWALTTGALTTGTLTTGALTTAGSKRRCWRQRRRWRSARRE